MVIFFFCAPREASIFKKYNIEHLALGRPKYRGFSPTRPTIGSIETTSYCGHGDVGPFFGPLGQYGRFPAVYGYRFRRHNAIIAQGEMARFLTMLGDGRAQDNNSPGVLGPCRIRILVGAPISFWACASPFISHI